MVGARAASYLPIADCDELRVEDILAQPQNGVKGILEFCLWVEEAEIIDRPPDPQGVELDGPTQAHRARAGHPLRQVLER